jgi:ubiquinol-cytochrome c reductase subunit 7
MLRSLSGHVLKYLTAFTSKDLAAMTKPIIPRVRGEFNVYEVFPIQQPWYRYSLLKDEELTWWEKIDKQAVLMWRSGMRYEQFGLLYDDIIGDEVPLVIEAINRLPKEVKEARDRRLTRAFDLSSNQKRLPKEQWTKWEDDVAYLKPYIAWVRSEFEEHDAEAMARSDIPIPYVYKFNTDMYENKEIFYKRQVD